MATFDPNIYRTGMLLDERRSERDMNAFQNIMGMMARQEMLNEERLNQQRKEAAAQAMQPGNIHIKAQTMGLESLSPQERAAYEFARAQSTTGYQDAAGNFVVTRQMPALGGYGAVQAMQGGAPEQVQQPMAAQAPSMDAPTFDGVSQRIKQSPAIQMEREKANIELEKEAKKSEFEKAKARPSLDRAFRSKISDMTNINDIIDDTVAQVDFWTTGLTGSVGSLIPGTQSSDMRANLSTIKGDAAFSTLQSMRDASPTGGALGSISERELGLLQNARAALDEDQSEDQLKENLKNYKRVRTEAIKNVAEAYKDDYGQYPEGFEKVLDVLSGDTSSKPVGEMSTEELLKALEGM